MIVYRPSWEARYDHRSAVRGRHSSGASGEEPWTSAELAEVRQTLEEEAAGLRDDLAKAELQVADRLNNGVGDAGDDEADVGVKTFERDHEFAMTSNARNLLEQTEKVLARIDAGSYGVCESCGQPIGKARLMAFPRAVLCVTCKQREELDGSGARDGPAPELYARTRHGTRMHGTKADAEAPGGRKLPVVIGVAVFVLALDVVTKIVVVHTLAHHAPIRLLGGFLTLQMLRNSGAAFSIGTSMTIVFTVIAVAVIIYILRAARKLRSLPWAITLGLLLGGATGNLSDRIFRSPGLFRGDVVDWIELPHWPVFNLADSAIVCGGALAVLLALRGVRMDGTREGHRKTI